MSTNFNYIKLDKEDIDKYSKKLYREIDIDSNVTDPNRNYELEKRIKQIEKHNKDYGVNLYGSLDTVPNDIKLLRLEELKYIKDNPHLYQYKQR